MRDYRAELERRTAFIRSILQQAGASGVVFGNSGGKDSALVGILCKAACPNTVGVILPCASRRSFGQDAQDAAALAAQFDIETRTLDLTAVREAAVAALGGVTQLSAMALSNLAPRLRMLSLYAVAASENRLVAGTGNRSEAYMGYFTKWGDGAYDFNPIGDLTVTEIYEFLEFLHAPRCVIDKAPSAALFDGQTDEAEMGVAYADIDRYLFTGEATDEARRIIERYHRGSAHKRRMPPVYASEE